MGEARGKDSERVRRTLLQGVSRVPNWVRIAGAFFVPVALFGTMAVSGEISEGRAPGATAFAIVGGTWLAALLLLFARRLVRVIPDGRRVELAWGVLVPFGREASELPQDAQVALVRARVLMGRFRNEVFRVQAQGGQLELPIADRRSYLEARRFGEEAAKLLGLPLLDQAAAHERLRPTETLDTPLRDLLLAGPPIAAPGPDAPGALSESPGGDHPTFVLGEVGLTVLGLVLVQVLLAVVGAGVYYLDVRFFKLLGVIGAVVAVPWSVHSCATRNLEELVLRPEAVVLLRHYRIGSRSFSMPVDALEELVPALRPLNGPIEDRGLLLVSDAQVLHFGRALDDAQREWLTRRLEHHLQTAT